MPIEKMSVPTSKDEIAKKIIGGVEEFNSAKFEMYEEPIRDAFLNGSLIDADTYIVEINEEMDSIVLKGMYLDDKEYFIDTLTIDKNGHVTTNLTKSMYFRQHDIRKSPTDIARSRLTPKNGPEFNLSKEEIKATIGGIKKSIERDLLGYNTQYSSDEQQQHESLMKILSRIASNISKRE